MRWPWSTPTRDERGLEKARQALAKARADEPRVASVVENLQRKQAENHFGPKIHAALSRPHREHP